MKCLDYDTVNVFRDGDPYCEHDWVIDEAYTNGNKFQFICENCGRFELKKKKEEKPKKTFQELYREFHENALEPIKLPEVLYEDCPGLTYIRGYLIDRNKVTINSSLSEAGLDCINVGVYETDLEVVGVVFDSNQSGVIDIHFENIANTSEELREMADREIYEKMLKVGFTEMQLKKLEMKSYIVATHHY